MMSQHGFVQSLIFYKGHTCKVVHHGLLINLSSPPEVMASIGYFCRCSCINYEQLISHDGAIIVFAWAEAIVSS